MLPLRDRALVQIVDDALADATARGGAWLACRPGCTPCCQGVFRISQLDAARLRAALATLAAQEPERAAAIVARARQAVSELSLLFPGNAATGVLTPLPEAEADWDLFADLPQADGACPVLDPTTGRCELYSGRPLTCRIFGPPVQNEAGIGVCELCYQGASEEQILAGEMHLRHSALEAELDRELAAELTGLRTTKSATTPPGELPPDGTVLDEALLGETIIAWALAAPPPSEGRAPDLLRTRAAVD